jgi:HPt (histidine-containing phosphotransfer) domain-containing protein
MNLDQALDTIGIDKNKTLKRFSGNREMLKYFVKQFPQDKTIAQLKKAFPEKNWETIEDTAHTLKGISGNLGFESLYKLCTSLVDEIRSKNYSKAELLYPAVISSCDKIVEIIKQID